VGAKSGQSKSRGRASGRKRLGLVVFAVLFIGLFVGFAIAQGVGAPSVPSGDAALVTGVPSDVGTITEAEVKRSLAQQAAQANLKKPPKEGEKKYEELQEAAMTELLNEIWIHGEAEELGISVTPKEIETELEQVKKQNFKTEAEFQEFLKNSNFTEEDIDKRVEIQTLSKQIQESITKAAGPATNEEIEAYYENEKATQFSTPASRDVRVIINEDKSEVEKAKAALEKDNSPANWKKVATKYSSDPTTKSKGGLQEGITEQFVKGELKEAIFETPTGQLTGPVKFEKNYFLTEVVKLNPEKVQTLKEAKPQISSTLTQQNQQEAFSEFITEFESKWKSRSYCASDFMIKICANYVGNGHSPSAVPACYEANPKTPPSECPAPVAQAVPAMPGTVTESQPKGEQLPQRPRPQAAGKTGVGATEAPPAGAPPAEAPPTEAAPPPASESPSGE
jgi:foldase protein PrsA